MLSVFASAEFIDDSGVSSERSLLSKIFGTAQSIWGDVLVQPGESKIYTAQQTSGHACGNRVNVPIEWVVRAPTGVTTGAFEVVRSDSTTWQLVVGAYAGHATIRWINEGDYELKVIYSCFDGTKVTEGRNVKVASVCSSTCKAVGDRECTNNVAGTSPGFRECKLVNGCLVWGSGWNCGSNQQCLKSPLSGKLSCQAVNECTPNTAECLSTIKYKACEYDLGSYKWKEKSVPTGFECINDGLVRKSSAPVDPCLSKTCDDGNDATSDRCEAGSCVFDPQCEEGETFFNGECQDTSSICEESGSGDCDASVWLDYPDCSWDNAQCEGDFACVIPSCDAVTERVNVNTCSCEPLSGCTMQETRACDDKGLTCSEGVCKEEDDGDKSGVPDWVLTAGLVIITILVAAIVVYMGFKMVKK